MILQKRLALAYLFFVGFPLLLIFRTLEAGRSLVAPPAIGGEWSVTLDRSVPRTNCSDLLPNAQPFPLRISQSGTSLSIVLESPLKTVMTAALISGRFAGSAVPIHVTGCAGVAMAIEGNVVGEARGRSLAGRFLFGGCPACTAVPFNATRQTPSGRQD